MSTTEKIKEQLAANKVVLFMKGTPQFPMCGFSSRTVEALKQCGEEFGFVNVLADPDIRQELPKYSDWPTFPQLFINGELVGGCDIAMELFDKGELQQMVKAAMSSKA